VVCAMLVAGCKSTVDLEKAAFPSNDRDWAVDQQRLTTAEFSEDASKITVRNIRNCSYITGDAFIVDYYDDTFDVADVQSVDFFVVPFASMPNLAHTMISFGMRDGRYLGVSVEVRKETGESYNPVRGMMRQYEIMYVVADERDMIQLRTHARGDDVYLYRTKASPEACRQLFVEVMQRVNKLAEEPEFYDTLINNCTTNIADHVNNLAPNRIPYDYRVLLPGLSDQLLYEVGLIDNSRPFAEVKANAKITEKARRFSRQPDFSQRVRE
jgi:hypothetical protein